MVTDYELNILKAIKLRNQHDGGGMDAWVEAKWDGIPGMEPRTKKVKSGDELLAFVQDIKKHIEATREAISKISGPVDGGPG